MRAAAAAAASVGLSEVPGSIGSSCIAPPNRRGYTLVATIVKILAAQSSRVRYSTHERLNGTSLRMRTCTYVRFERDERAGDWFRRSAWPQIAMIDPLGAGVGVDRTTENRN